MRVKAAGSGRGKATASMPVRSLQRAGVGSHALTKAFRDFDARLEQAHRRADQVLDKLSKR